MSQSADQCRVPRRHHARFAGLFAVHRAWEACVVESSRELAWIRGRLTGPLPPGEDAAVIATNLEGMIAYWSRGAEHLYGWSDREALGRDILDVTPARYTRQQSTEIMLALQSGEPWGGEILLRRRDDSPVLAFVLDIPVGDLATGQGAIIGISAPVEASATIQACAPEICAALRHRFATN